MKRNVAFDSQNVVALVLFDRLVQRLFCLFAGSSHNRVVVVERHHVRHHIGDDRRIGSDEGFRAAGAFQAVEPDNGRARFGFHRMGDFLRTGAPESEARRSERAELQEAFQTCWSPLVREKRVELGNRLEGAPEASFFSFCRD